MNFSAMENAFRPTSDGKCSEAEHGMVSSAFPDATKAGVKMLGEGGNAVDAAVATALALAVCEPQASGLGGQTMMLIKTEKKVVALDGSSRAPSLAHVKEIRIDDRTTGYRATTVPSTPATLWYVHHRYGVLPWRKVMGPAIRLAEDGYRITELQHRLQERELDNFLKVESGSGAKYFLRDGKPYQTGELFKQPVLVKLLRLMEKTGVEEFYKGEVAKRIDADMQEHGGLLRYDDLALIPWPIERRPVRQKYRGLRVYSMPPPGAGRTLLYTLLMINAISPDALVAEERRRANLLAMVFRKAFLERVDRPFDADFYPQVSEKEMLNKRYARRCIKRILSRVDRTLLSAIAVDEGTRGETTHVSVMDEEGMAVSLTQSIERVYGSKAAAEDLGFLYNNYISDYEYEVVGHPFYLRPNAVPWATVAPTLILNGEMPWMAVGSPGSDRIFSTIVQFLIHVIDEGMPICKAMAASRLHCSIDGRVSIEAQGFPDDLVEYLEGRGYKIERREQYSFYHGSIHAVMKKQNGMGFQGVADIRRDGTAGGE